MELRNGCAELERSLEILFHEVDQMREELTTRMHRVEQERVRLEDRGTEIVQRSHAEVDRLNRELAERETQLAETLAELRFTRDAMERQHKDTIGRAARREAELSEELESLRQALSRREAELSIELQTLKHALTRREAELSEELETLQQTWSRREAELSEEAEALRQAMARREVELSEQLATLDDTVVQERRDRQALVEQHDALQSRWQAVERQLADAAGNQSRLADLERELAAARRRLTEAQEELQVRRATTADETVSNHAEQTVAWQRERESLEAELERVRHRATELNETVAQQRKALAEQNSELSGELQQLRRLVEKQAELVGDRGVSAKEEPTSRAGVRPGAPPVSDPVVSSVLAQFAKLQKDVAQRRRRKPSE